VPFAPRFSFIIDMMLRNELTARPRCCSQKRARRIFVRVDTAVDFCWNEACERAHGTMTCQRAIARARVHYSLWIPITCNRANACKARPPRLVPHMHTLSHTRRLICCLWVNNQSAVFGGQSLEMERSPPWTGLDNTPSQLPRTADAVRGMLIE